MYSLPFFGIAGSGQTLSTASIYDYLETLTPDESIIPSIYEYFKFTSLAIAINNPNKAPSANPVDYVFTISRSTPRNVTTTVDYRIVNVLNTLASDFVGGVFPSSTLVFAPGETTKTVTATIIGGAALGKTFAFELVNAIDSDGGMITTSDRIECKYGEVPLALNAVLWLDASDASTISATNNLVSQWRDKSGFNRHASQGTGTNQPTYQNGVINFDGVNDFFTVPSFTGNRIISVFIVANASSTREGYLLDESGSLSIGGGLSTRFTSSSRIRFWGQNGYPLTDSSLYSTGTTYIIGGIERETQRNVYLNGVTPGSLTVQSSTRSTANPRIGHSVQLGDFFHGYISEIILIDTAISENDRQQMEGYLANKWGLTASLPAGHPYKP